MPLESAASAGPTDPQFLSVREAASLLGVSECWVRRHAAELPVVRVGRLIRFDSALLLQRFRAIHPVGSRLTGRTEMTLQVRRYQRGTVYKKGHRVKMWYGVWRVDVRKSDGTIGRRQRWVKLGSLAELPTRSAAFERLSKLMGANNTPSVDMKFSELVERWQGAVYPTLKDTTGDNYLYNVKAYVEPIFGNREISTITRYDVEIVLANQASKYCRNTIRGMRAAFRRVMSWAVSHDWISDNPCFRVDLPMAPKRVVRAVLKPQQVKAISGELCEPYATLVLFLAITGLRIGEGVAIKWSDFDNDVLQVSRRIYEGKIGPTKRKKSERELPIPSVLLARMKEMRESLDNRQKSSEWVFPSRKGTPVEPKNAMRRYVRPAADKLGIAIGGWHDFRHTVATKMLRRGESPKVVSDILGNSVEMLLKVYDHPEIEDFRAPLNDMANQLLADVRNGPSGD